MNLKQAQKALKALENPERAKHSQGFFKTGKGGYAEGDVFIGATMPQLRTLAKQAHELDDTSIESLLHSKVHEQRMLALLILLLKSQKANKSKDTQTQKKLYNYYLKQTKHINNWDLVDVSCRDIIGGYLVTQTDRRILYKLVASKDLWERRIAIISTWTFIREEQFTDTLKLCEKLLTEKHDLIHKASGWMLREVGKRQLNLLTDFLDLHAANMPRTMLRYAIEKLDTNSRKHYLAHK